MTLTPSAEELFKHNLHQVAKKFGLIDDDIPSFPVADAVKVLNLAEDLSFSPADEERLMSLILCALVWENRSCDWHAIKPFIGRILIRLGLGTSAKMVNWNTEHNLFESLGSIVDDLTSTTKLIQHEVKIQGHKIILSDFQKRMWDAIDEYARVGVSAPTSAGKSFVLINKVIETLAKSNGKVVFIVPTISLITQVCNDLRKKIKEYGLTDIYVSQTVNDVSLFKSDKIIYALTQERAASALNHPDADFSEIKLLIVDEIQNIEKVANEEEERAKILLDVIQTFKNDLSPEKIIIAGPRVENIADLVKKWFGEGARSVSDILPAVLNVTYTFKPSRGKLEFQQLIIPGIKHSIKVEDKYNLKGKVISKVRYHEMANSFIASVIDRNKSDGNIIFSDSTKNANAIALAVAGKLSPDQRFDRMDSVKSFVESSVHPKYSLIQALDKGVAYHHSKMPAHIRTLVEKLFGQKHLNTIVSTTTLMQGINLPAKNIIIRNPKVGDDTLTGYEFSNLKGRAGRLMKDFVGRALIIDEQQCADAAIDLEVADQKSITMGFNSRYEQEKVQILDILANNRQPLGDDNHDIVTYIRNMCLKYGVNGLHRLHEVGISVSQEIFQTTLTNVQALSIPKSICLNNFYWDPFVLNSIYVNFKNDGWPVFPSTIVGAANALQQIAIRLFQVAPYYYGRYLGNIDPTTDYGPNKLLSLCIYATNFGSGKPIKDVIDTPSFPVEESDDIDDRIADVQTKVVYGIPKLLKPIFHINDLVNRETCSHILSFIEVGAFDPKLRTLIEIGVPRETAIAMLQHVRNIDFLDENGKISERMLERFIAAARQSPQISEWHKLLIEDL